MKLTKNKIIVAVSIVVICIAAVLLVYKLLPKSTLPFGGTDLISGDFRSITGVIEQISVSSFVVRGTLLSSNNKDQLNDKLVTIVVTPTTKYNKTVINIPTKGVREQKPSFKFSSGQFSDLYPGMTVRLVKTTENIKNLTAIEASEIDYDAIVTPK